jgi:1,4-dihydroxy-2-naphthoate octaprenyltransferase
MSRVAKAWWLAMRPKTLPAAFVPVLTGSACAQALGSFHWVPSLAALFGALLLQIASNFANDVYDFEKGADTSERVGPTRAVQAGLISPRAMKRGLLLVLALALLVGIYLAAHSGPMLVVIGLASMLAAVAYTAGPFPLGYHGLGELFVMIFFGFVAVCGTAFVNIGSVPALAVFASIPVGSLASAILVVNNVRDLETDARAGKRTLVVRFGRQAGLREFWILLCSAYVVPALLLVTSDLRTWIVLPLVTLPWGVKIAGALRTERGTALNATLADTAKLLLVFGVLFSAGLWLGARGA